MISPPCEEDDESWKITDEAEESIMPLESNNKKNLV